MANKGSMPQVIKIVVVVGTSGRKLVVIDHYGAERLVAEGV